MLGSPVLQGAVQAGDLLALGTRSSASSKGGGGLARAVQQSNRKARRRPQVSWLHQLDNVAFSALFPVLLARQLRGFKRKSGFWGRLFTIF